MSSLTLRAAYSNWPRYNQALRDAVAQLTDEQLAVQPAPERWPLWATVGHLACQRVSWLCGFLGGPGAETTPFPDALYRCPGDEYLEPAMSAGQLADALDWTFRIIEDVLDRWTLDMLDEEIRRDFGGDLWVHTRGSVIQRVFAHDIYHSAELNEALGRAGLAQVDFWD
ncbi:MAG TPA: DinB family protein [Candidatus Limnocylindria bacterium]|nr:DinB family protein [Candidatus Limnocylindria bacterium]